MVGWRVGVKRGSAGIRRSKIGLVREGAFAARCVAAKAMQTARSRLTRSRAFRSRVWCAGQSLVVGVRVGPIPHRSQAGSLKVSSIGCS